MTEQEILKAIQERHKCEHIRKPGEACDADSGGWWTCMCAVAAWKTAKQYTPEEMRALNSGMALFGYTIRQS